MKRVLLLLMITHWKVLLNSLAVYGEKKLLDQNYVNLVSSKVIKTEFCCLPCLSSPLFPQQYQVGSLGLKTLGILYSTPGLFKQVSNIPPMTTYCILLCFVFTSSGFALYAPCFKKSVPWWGLHFGITNRRILSQLHDVFLKYLINILAVA